MRPGLRVHIATVGFKVRRITEPLIRERADKVYLITRSGEDRAAAYLEKILKILRKERYLQVEKRTTDIWNLFDCLQTYKNIINEEEKGEKNTHIYINISTGSKISCIAGTMACMIWKGTPYYAHMEYNDKKDPADGLPDEDVTAIDEIPVYSINKPKPESIAVLKILDRMKVGRQGEAKMKKSRLIEELEEAGIIDKNASIGAKHSKLKGLLNSISVAGSDNPLVEVEYKGKQSNVILTPQGESTLKIFGD
jgi:hypothetical protein